MAACTVTWVVGMMIGYSGQKPSSDAAPRPIVALGGVASPEPTTATATATTTTTTASPTAGPAATTTTTAPGAAAGPPTVLMENTPGQGPSDLPVFTAGGPWSIGWHFRCVNAPGGTGTFTLQVIPDPGGPPAAAVQQTSREAQGITPQPSPGRQHLKVITDPACQWAVKVTGVAP